MLLLVLTGNFGSFPLLVLTLCLSLVDDDFIEHWFHQSPKGLWIVTCCSICKTYTYHVNLYILCKSDEYLLATEYVNLMNTCCWICKQDELLGLLAAENINLINIKLRQKFKCWWLFKCCWLFLCCWMFFKNKYVAWRFVLKMFHLRFLVA